jgi:hypothetical protein
MILICHRPLFTPTPFYTGIPFLGYMVNINVQ